MKERIKLHCKFAGTVAVTALLGLAMMMQSGCASAPKCVVENGRIVVDSPFDLEIGSTEYAKMFGSLVKTEAFANYDPKTKTTTTNRYHHAEARLATPYFGCESVSLSFKGEEKALESCHLSIGHAWSSDKRKMSYAECRETVNKIVADMSKHLDITMRCGIESSEKEAKESVRKSLEEYKRKKKKCYGLARSFVCFTGEKTIKNVRVDYSVSGLINEKGQCDIHVSYSKHPDFLSFWKSGDKIPVYTNEMFSATSGKLVPTAEQKRAHAEAKKLRETVNRLFGIDLDNPSETNELSSALWQATNAQAAVRREWTPMQTPFEGMTERKISQTVRFLEIPFGMFAMRRPFDGDVTDDELKAQARRFLDRLEREYGAKIPEGDTAEGADMLAKMFGSGIPTFGDTKALLGLDKTQYFIGKVGDLSVEVSYAAPRYVKKGGRFEISCKGAVVVNIIQSPIITKASDNGGNSCADKSHVALTNVAAEDVLPAPFGIRLGTELKPEASAKSSNAKAHTLSAAHSRSGITGINGRGGGMVARALPEPFLGKAAVNIVVNDAHVGYRFSVSGNYRRGLSRAESLKKIESLRAAVEKECGFSLNPYMFYVGEVPECEQTKSMPGFGADLWEDMDYVRAISLTKHGRLKVAIHCSIKNATSYDMDAPVAVSVVFSLPDIESAMKKRFEDEKIRREKAERMTLSEFCGIKFGEPSNLPTNGLERVRCQTYRMQYNNEPVTTNSYFVWLGRRMDIIPPKLFDLVKVNYSYKTLTPYSAEFCGHFPKGATRKECLEHIDAFVADINGRYGLNLSCSCEGNRIEEEPACFKPGETPKNRQNHHSRYMVKDGASFCQYDFSNPNLYVQIEAGENRYGERIVLMHVNDHTCDEDSEGLIPSAPEDKSAAEVIQAEDDPVFR